MSDRTDAIYKLSTDQQIKILKRLIVQAAKTAGEGHIPSAFSILDILWVLYERVLKVDPKHPDNPNRDRFVLSKGQASLGLYAILSNKGFFPKSYFKTYSQFSSILGGHPDSNKIPGVEASTGSLGHGLPMAVGMALGLKILGNRSKVFCLVGDGECNEGSIWESILIAAHHQLDNLACIVDYNHSTDRALQLGNLKQKFNSFGWETVRINGHNHQEIYQALKQKTDKKPYCVIAQTIKGYGCKLMENNPAWHHKAPNEEEFKEIMEQLV
ncbi:transketolase [Patescibacteria group bacterium]|nr:transketolase [Patescibacteria group bacterium]MCL5409267.1 transketolase [Patescibacteria group bacterium]